MRTRIAVLAARSVWAVWVLVVHWLANSEYRYKGVYARSSACRYDDEGRLGNDGEAFWMDDGK